MNLIRADARVLSGAAVIADFKTPKGQWNPSHDWLTAAVVANLVLMMFAGHASGQTPPTVPSPSDLKKLSLDQLQGIEVTSVSKSPEKLSGAPSSIQVITGDDIRRSGATSIPEALRLASNLQVAQVDSHTWAITARGFNNNPANKLLVLIDGRAVYSPVDAGVFWDVQDTLLEDIDRIEVISGPGGTLWGDNAVNGVINIITKNAKDTQGGSSQAVAVPTRRAPAACAMAAVSVPVFSFGRMASISIVTVACCPTVGQ